MSARAPQAAPRTRRVPSRGERVMSWTIIGTLPLIVAAVYVKSYGYDPNLFALNPAALVAPRTASPAAARPAVRVARDPDLAPPAATLPKRLAALDWDADGPAEQFTRETLYQKIDGRADEYLRDGFARLETISYAQGGAFIDVLLYDMGDEGHARSRFHSERPGGAEGAALGRDGYCVAASCFFIDGRYYVQVIGSDAGTEVVHAVRAAARGVALLTSQRQP